MCSEMRDMIKKHSSFGLAPSSNAQLKCNVADAASWFLLQVNGKSTKSDGLFSKGYAE